MHGPYTRPRRLIVISDFCDRLPPIDPNLRVEEAARAWINGDRGPSPGRAIRSESERDCLSVVGGYLERLPLACVKSQLCDEAEIWTFTGRSETPSYTRDSKFLSRRSFRAEASRAPFASNDMLGHISAFGPPEILCVWGLGVDETIMQACASSVKIYNSIDSPALRIPPEISEHFDLVVTGAEWQSDEVRSRHREMATLVLPIGPEFASPETFFPLQAQKIYDVIYVAAAQAYKRHDVLFDALARLPPSTRALCVFGYGELGEALRARAADLGINVDFVGPPGVGFSEVNRLMNLAKVGVVCGIDDGAPAIITEYMLAGLPVLANADLRCGLQFITPETGQTAKAEDFHHGLINVLAHLEAFRPRETVLANWSWPHSVQKLADAMTHIQREKNPK